MGVQDFSSACRNECIPQEPPPKTRLFTGPVKIIVAEHSRKHYIYKVLQHYLIIVCYLMMGLTVTTMVFISLSPHFMYQTRWHISLCTVGFQMLILLGVLIMNPVHGPTSVLSLRERRQQHWIMQTSALTLTALGVFVLLVSGSEYPIGPPKNETLTFHCTTGLMAFFLAGGNAVVGLFVPSRKGPLRILHLFLGSVACAMASLCFILGIIRECVYEHFRGNKIINIILTFIVFYTLFVLSHPLYLYFQWHMNYSKMMRENQRKSLVKCEHGHDPKPRRNRGACKQ